METKVREFDFSEFVRRRKNILALQGKEAEKRKDLALKFARLFEKYHVKRAYLFGSVQKGLASPGSDIDIYVEEITARDFWNLRQELEEFAGCPVDLYCQLDAPVFTRKIKERGKLIYET